MRVIYRFVSNEFIVYQNPVPVLPPDSRLGGWARHYWKEIVGSYPPTFGQNRNTPLPEAQTIGRFCQRP